MSSYNDDIFNQSDDDILNDNDFSEDNSRAAEYMASHMKETHGININADDFISDLSKDSNSIRSKIYISLAEASATWVSHSNTAAFTRSTHHILDELTQGRYSKLYYLYDLEGKIIQRKIILQFLKMMSDTSHEDFAQLRKVLNIDLDDLYMSSFVGTFYNIAQYTINSQVQVYLALANDLAVVPSKDIEDINSLLDLSFLQKKFIVDSFSSYVTEEYITHALSKISPEQS
jgi:hypothetical protein